ncbi:MAG: hypothetical protein GF317_19215 [Candidatus Lokiarchaeota archaeon]|nr:hypothetical protein [Candidatus Lokiarchaeota archaeon]
MPFDINKYVKDEALKRLNINGNTLDGQEISKLLKGQSEKLTKTISTVLGVGIGGFLGGLIGNWLGDWLQGLFNNAWSKTEVVKQLTSFNTPSYFQDILTPDNIYASEKENRDGGNILGHFKYWIISFDIGKGYGSRSLLNVIQDGDLQEINDTLIYFGNMIIEAENNSLNSVGGKVISGDKHRVLFEVIKAGSLRAMNMLASRFEELSGSNWGNNLEITPDPEGGYQVEEKEPEEKSNTGLVLTALLAILGRG